MRPTEGCHGRCRTGEAHRIADATVGYIFDHDVLPGASDAGEGRGIPRSLTAFEAFGVALAALLLESPLKRRLVAACLHETCAKFAHATAAQQIPLYQAFGAKSAWQKVGIRPLPPPAGRRPVGRWPGFRHRPADARRDRHCPCPLRTAGPRPHRSGWPAAKGRRLTLIFSCVSHCGQRAWQRSASWLLSRDTSRSPN